MQNLIMELEDAIQALPGKIKPDTPLNTLDGWDSMGLVAFISAVSERYGVELMVEDLRSSATLADLHELLVQRAGADAMARAQPSHSRAA
jgi:acyl carrier protein